MAATLPVEPSRIVARLSSGDLVDATVAEINDLLGAVVGPASSTDNALARFDLATGKLIQDSLVLLDDTGNLTGIAELETSGVINAGDPGFESGGVNIGGVMFDSIFKANDIGGSQPAQSVIHRHSTTLQAALLGTRSKTDDDNHAPLTNGDSAFSIFGAYRTVGQYDLCGEILFKAAAGTISATSSPGTIIFKTTPDGSTVPADVLTLDEDKSATFTGNIAVTGTVDGRDIAADGSKVDDLTGINRLINGNFITGQRGISFTSATTPANSDDTYLLDRWVLLSDGNDIVDVTRGTDGSVGDIFYLRADVETVSKKFGFLQIIENRNLSGLISGSDVVSLGFNAKVSDATKLSRIKAVVLSWDSTADAVTSDVVSAWNIEGTIPTFATNWTAENAPVDLNVTNSDVRYVIENIAIDTANTANLAVFIWSDDIATNDTLGTTLDITNVQLEEGASSTVFEFEIASLVLEKCKAYYRKQGVGMQGNATNTTTAAFGYTFDPFMRSPPTVAVTTTTAEISESGVGNKTATAGTLITAVTPSTTGGGFDLDGFTGLTAQNHVIVKGDVITFSAEL